MVHPIPFVQWTGHRTGQDRTQDKLETKVKNYINGKKSKGIPKNKVLFSFRKPDLLKWLVHTNVNPEEPAKEFMISFNAKRAEKGVGPIKLDFEVGICHWQKRQNIQKVIWHYVHAWSAAIHCLALLFWKVLTTPSFERTVLFITP